MGFVAFMENGFGGKEYKTPKKMIKKPRKIGKRILSDEQRKKIGERLNKVRAKH